jgi:hypothetical protein
VLDKVFSTCKLKPVSASLIWCRSACLHKMLTRESKFLYVIRPGRETARAYSATENCSSFNGGTCVRCADSLACM